MKFEMLKHIPGGEHDWYFQIGGTIGEKAFCILLRYFTGRGFRLIINFYRDELINLFGFQREIGVWKFYFGRKTMELYLVTFRDYGTQFIVNDHSEERAIELAAEVNKTLGEIEGLNLEDKTLYDCEKIDFSLLKELIKREDYYGATENVIIFD